MPCRRILSACLQSAVLLYLSLLSLRSYDAASDSLLFVKSLSLSSAIAPCFRVFSVSHCLSHLSLSLSVCATCSFCCPLCLTVLLVVSHPQAPLAASWGGRTLLSVPRAPGYSPRPQIKPLPVALKPPHRALPTRPELSTGSHQFCSPLAWGRANWSFPVPISPAVMQVIMLETQQEGKARIP